MSVKTHLIVVKNGNEILARRSTNLPTAQQAIHDAIRHVHGYGEAATAKIMESNPDNFKLKNPKSGTTIKINRI